MSKPNKTYKYYACCKFSQNNGVFLEGRNSCEEAWADLKRLNGYVHNGTIFIGVVKCADRNPLSHVK